MSEAADQIAGYYLDVPGHPELAKEAGLEFVGHYHSRAAVEEHGLVLLSIGLPYWVYRSAAPDNAVHLYVKESAGPFVREELQRYDAETKAWQKATQHDPLPTREYRAGTHFAFAWVISLLTAFRLQHSDPDLQDRLLNDNFAFFYSQEWWRPLSSLFLHADTQHLLNNMTMGLLFGVLCSKSMGALLAWSLILVGGVLGNILTGWYYLPEAHRALGASTAVFAAVGVLSGHGGAETMRDRSRRTLFRRALPLLGGAVLLGWYGFGTDPRTDVVAHVIGFFCGAGLGLCAGAVQIKQLLREEE